MLTEKFDAYGDVLPDAAGPSGHRAVVDAGSRRAICVLAACRHPHGVPVRVGSPAAPAFPGRDRNRRETRSDALGARFYATSRDEHLFLSRFAQLILSTPAGLAHSSSP